MPETTAARQAARLLFLHAQTGLHPGSGTALGAVDLPVQRERHTQWPTVPGSALKGILRDLCRERAKESYQDEYEKEDGGVTRHTLKRSRRRVANEEDPQLVAVFGPGRVDESNSHAGALSVTDARILAFPVRSLRGVFAWVTCPAALQRFDRDLRLAGLALPPGAIPPLAEGQAACAGGELLVDGDKLVLEEFEFTRTGSAAAVAGWIAEQAIADEATRGRMCTHLAVLHDNDFTHFARHGTEIVARVGLDYDRKTVREGALFYQEFLPAETLFYAVVLASASRSEKQAMTAAAVLDYLGEHVRDGTLLQVGGDETTGKGLCLARLSNGKGV
jgi:CRISPR-associated protein Cmr4